MSCKALASIIGAFSSPREAMNLTYAYLCFSFHLVYRIDQHCEDDGHTLGTPHIYEYLFRVMYNRRSKFNPLWNALVVGGVHKGER